MIVFFVQNASQINLIEVISFKSHFTFLFEYDLELSSLMPCGIWIEPLTIKTGCINKWQAALRFNKPQSNSMTCKSSWTMDGLNTGPDYILFVAMHWISSWFRDQMTSLLHRIVPIAGFFVQINIALSKQNQSFNRTTSFQCNCHFKAFSEQE